MVIGAWTIPVLLGIIVLAGVALWLAIKWNKIRKGEKILEEVEAIIEANKVKDADEGGNNN